MLTYYEVMTTDLGLLTTAAGKWDSMAGELKRVEDRYGDSVQKVTLGQSWTGISVGVAHTNFAATRYEYAAAQTQAKAIAALLRDAHSQFTDLKKRVESARDEAVAAGMTVSEQGNVAYDYAKLTAQERSALHHDPDGETMVRDAVAKWQQHIDERVKVVSEADQGVKIALDAVGVDSNKDAFGKGDDETLDGFNAGAQGDIEVYEARNAEDIATRINGGEKVSAAEYAELNRSFRDNGDNKAFSQTFLAGLGTDGTVKLSDKLNKREYQDLERGLANTVAGATQVPGKTSEMPPGSKKFNDWLNSPDGTFYREWTGSLDKSGTRNFGSNTDPLYGYQSFVSMMQHADAKFDDQFMYQLADDMIAAEKKQEGIFTKWGGGHKDIESDPIDGLLAVMSRNPDAATAFFDSQGNGPAGDKVGNDHLEYLLGSGDDAREWPKNTVTGIAVTTFDDPTSRIGLGAALEAATTGREPNAAGASFGGHSEAQARVMQETISVLDKDSKGDTIAQNLKVPLGRALSDYTADTHAILSGTAPGSPTGLEDISAHGDDSAITNSKHSLLRVMRGVSDAAYGTTPGGEPVLVYDLLYENEKRYAAGYLLTAKDAAPDQVGNVVGDWDNKARDVGEVFGAMNAIGSDMTLDDRDTKIGKLNDAMRYTYHGVGGLFTQIPVVGDPIQRMVDAATYEYSKGVALEAEDVARSKDSASTSAGIGGTNSLLDAWGTERGTKGSVAHDHAKGEAEQSYITGREDAYSALRTRK
ncbi:hypothetical protein [Streptomyces sp. NRRL S-237]|uniref:hypothetical protein n=1 Tax=Streptomyces sp. NRRL S-237 TaxID=1463895 RepID=UPI0004CC05A8|nr:hypothetical protein [Streptomyces sp. NRRL S-237]